MAGPVLKVRKVIDTLTPKLSAMQAKQMPFAIALSLTRTGQAEFITRQPWDTLAPRLQNFPAPASFSF